MNITPASLASTFVGFNTVFWNSFRGAQPSAEVLATRVPSSGEANVYAFMVKLLRMRKWLGDRVIQNVASRSAQITNEPFEMTVAVERKKIVDDQLGIYRPMISEMGRQTALWMDDLLVAALQAGASTSSGIDAVNFFSTTHPIDPDGRVSGTQSNLVTAADLTEATFDDVRTKMANFAGADGRPLGTRVTHLVVPPQLELKALKILKAEYLASGASNVLVNSAQLIVLPQLANEATTWYAMDLSREIKPLIAQVREDPDFVSYTAPDSESVFKRDEYLFGSKARGAAGYGLWFLAIRANPSGT